MRFAPLAFTAALLLVWGVASADAAVRTPPPVQLRLAPGGAAAPELERFLREDQTWAERLPAPARLAAPPEEDAATRAWLARAVGRDGQSASPAPGGRLPDAEGEATRAGGGGRGLLSRLRDRWLARGYLAAVCVVPETAAPPFAPAAARGDSTPPASSPLLVEIAPGPLFHIGTVAVEGPDFPARARLLAATLPPRGTPFRADAWAESVDRLLLAAGEVGYPFARWVVREVAVDPEQAQLSLTATLFTGPRAWLGPQSCDLPEGRGAAFLRRASGLRTGARYRESDLERARERLLMRGLWARVDEPLVYAAGGSDTVGVHWPVAPVPRPNRFFAVIGFSRREGEDGGGRLSGQADLLLPNLAGSGRRLATNWSDDGQDRSRFGFGYQEPLAFGTPLDLEGTVAHEVAVDSYTRFSADLRARLAAVAAWGLELGLGWDRGTFPTGEWSRTSRVRARGAFFHRRGDPARSGWSGLFAFSRARRQAVVRADTASTVPPTTPIAGSVERQTLFELSWDGELFLGPALSLAGRAAYAQVRGEGAPIPLTEQYRFGGARTVRGYREEEFRGEKISHGALEIRIGRPGHSRLYTFFDLGYFRFRTATPTLEDPLARATREGTVRGFGLGLETRTAGGDISLAIGLPGTWDFDTAKLHVSLLQSF